MTTQRLLPFLAAGSLALALTGCSTDATPDATLSGASTHTSSSEGGDSTSAVRDMPDAKDSPAGTAKDDPHRAVHTGTDDGQCATANLDVGLTNEQGAAGSRLADIVFTNTGDSPCTLTGFPGVSAVTNNDGTQLGVAAERETGATFTTVTLAPGQTASAALRMTVVGIIDPAACQPQPADGLRVYPPGETASAFIRVEGLEGCAGDTHYLSVQPVTAT